MLLLDSGDVPDDAVVKVAQTFRSGTNDIDAIDYVEMSLDDEGQVELDELNDVYVLVNFRPAVTNENWRIDCGVAGYETAAVARPEQAAALTRGRRRGLWRATAPWHLPS